eukprot:8438649-Pyramimonas_sp.AAC.1
MRCCHQRTAYCCAARQGTLLAVRPFSKVAGEGAGYQRGEAGAVARGPTPPKVWGACGPDSARGESANCDRGWRPGRRLALARWSQWLAVRAPPGPNVGATQAALARRYI